MEHKSLMHNRESFNPSTHDHNSDRTQVWSRGDKALLFAVLGVSGLFSLHNLSVPSLWVDESVSWSMSSGDWGRLSSLCAGGEDCGGFMHSCLLKLWISVFGTDPPGRMRLLSAVAIIVHTGILVRIGSLLWGPQAGLCLGLLGATHPMVIFWSRQARGYALVLLWTTVALWGLIESLRSDRVKRHAVLLGWGSGLLVTTHVFGLFFVVGAGMVLAVAEIEKAGRVIPLRGLVRAVWPLRWPFLIAIGWGIVMRHRIAENLHDFWIRGSFLQQYEHVLLTLLPLPAMSVLLASLGLILLWRNRHRPSSRWALAVVSLVGASVLGGPLAASLLAHGPHNFILPHYVISFLPVALLPIAYALSRLPFPWGIVVAAVFGGAIIWHSDVPSFYDAENHRGDNAREAAQFLKRELRSNDLILLTPYCEHFTLEYYGIPGEVIEGPPDDDWTQYRDHWQDAARIHSRRSWVAHRIWLVLMNQRGVEPTPLHEFAQWRFGSLRIVRIDLDD